MTARIAGVWLPPLSPALGSQRAPEEGLNRGKIDRNDGGPNVIIAIKLAMASHSRGRVGRLDEAEDGATVMVKPIGPELCSEPILIFSIFCGAPPPLSLAVVLWRARRGGP